MRLSLTDFRIRFASQQHTHLHGESGDLQPDARRSACSWQTPEGR